MEGMDALPRLQDFIDRHRKLFVLTGAGCSADSGIPDYRDAEGQWKRKPPVTYQAFMGDAATRRRYWARSLIGWRSFSRAAPNRYASKYAAGKNCHRSGLRCGSHLPNRQSRESSATRIS